MSGETLCSLASGQVIPFLGCVRKPPILPFDQCAGPGPRSVPDTAESPPRWAGLPESPAGRSLRCLAADGTNPKMISGFGQLLAQVRQLLT